MKYFIYYSIFLFSISWVSCLQKDPATVTRSDIISGKWQLYTYSLSSSSETNNSSTPSFSYARCSQNCQSYLINFSSDNQFEIQLDEATLYGHYKLNESQNTLTLSMGNTQIPLQIKEFDRTWMMTQDSLGLSYLSAFREIE